LLLLIVLGDVEDGRHVVAKVELLEGGLDMLAGDRLLGVLFGDFVGFGGDEGDELDAALDEKVARVLGKSHARLAGQDVLNNLLDRGCRVVSLGFRVVGVCCGRACPLAATSHRCRRIRDQTWWERARAMGRWRGGRTTRSMADDDDFARGKLEPGADWPDHSLSTFSSSIPWLHRFSFSLCLSLSPSLPLSLSIHAHGAWFASYSIDSTTTQQHDSTAARQHDSKAA